MSGDLIILREIPLIAEIEDLLADPSIEWRPDFDAKCDDVSVRLFGVTAADTKPAEPHLDQFSSTQQLDDRTLGGYSKALGEWHQTEIDLWVPTRKEMLESELLEFWDDAGFDVTDANGSILRCLPRFARQMLATESDACPQARLTMDGSGSRHVQSAEIWGASLAEQARHFKTRDCRA